MMRCCCCCRRQFQRLPCAVGLLLLLLLPPFGELQVYGTGTGPARAIHPLTRLGWVCGNWGTALLSTGNQGGKEVQVLQGGDYVYQ